MDGSGNLSAEAAAVGPASKRALVADDATGSEIAFAGNWERRTNLLPAHLGTISSSTEKGASAEFSFEGGKVLVFSKLGADCGKAAFRIDDNAPETVDTYSADDIWGVCVFQKEVPTGRHTLHIEVLGEHSDHAKDSVVNVDGMRVAVE